MTLRGSVASFPLETIVQLLAATAKTGQLEVRSGKESGTLGFAEGRLVSAVSGDDAGDTALGAVFTISEGDFEFVPWGEPPDGNLAGDLNQLLDRAVVQRDKIVADREIISDDRVRFALSDRAAAEGEVRLSAEQWRALLAVNGERDLPGMAAQLKLGRLATLAMLADLVRAGILEVRDAPPEPPPVGPGSGPGGGMTAETPSFTSAPPVREWDRPRSEAAAWPAPVEPETAPPAAPEPEGAEPEPFAAAAERFVPAPEAPPAAPEPSATLPEPAPEVAAAWEAPPPIPPREVRTWDEPARDTPVWEQSAPAAPEPERPSWDATAAESAPPPASWDAPAAESAPPAASWDGTAAESAPPPASWDAPVERTRSWQPPAAPTGTERDWGLPAQDWERASPEGAAWPEPASTEIARPDAALNDALGDRIASLEGQEATAQAAPAADKTIDERLSALSGLFGTPPAQPAAPAWPAEERRAATSVPPVVEPAPAPPAEQPKKKGGLFSGLFKKEEPRAPAVAPAAAPAQQTGSRVAKLAAFANALLDEFNNGQYGKNRVDDRIANLLMRVDEQADPIDRPLPIVDDRIDVATLEAASMSERQVAPYLALLVSQIYQDAEHAFGKDKAKRGFKTVQTAVVGDSAALGTDLRLPRV